MTRRVNKRRRAKGHVERWQKAWRKIRARVSREVFVATIVLAAAAVAGLGTAVLWLPRHPAIVPDKKAEKSPRPAAEGPPAESARKAVDLSAAKWGYSASQGKSVEGQGEGAPRVRTTDLADPPWQRFAALTAEPQGRPMIAVVIDDVGVDRRRSARAITLPQPITLAFLPYATDVDSQAREARQLGHELLVHLPMEALDRNRDPGPHALTTELSDDELLRRLRWDLDRFDGYVGVNNHMGSQFTRDRHAMRLVLGELKERGLLFLDSRTVSDSAGPEVARELQLPFASRQVFLDDDQNALGVEARLVETERIARSHGFAIAIGHPHDGTLEALHQWLPRVQGDGFVLVPLSAIVRHSWAMEHSTARQPG